MHDIPNLSKPLIGYSIIISENVWTTSDVVIGMVVVIGEGAVVVGKSEVFNNVDPWIVVGGILQSF